MSEALFKKELPLWLATGQEIPNELSEKGWSVGDKPPADYFNRLQNQTYETLKELQENAVHIGVFQLLKEQMDSFYINELEQTNQLKDLNETVKQLLLEFQKTLVIVTSIVSTGSGSHPIPVSYSSIDAGSFTEDNTNYNWIDGDDFTEDNSSYTMYDGGDFTEEPSDGFEESSGALDGGTF